MSEYNPERAQQERIEAERMEYKIISRRVLNDLFKDVLDARELERRLMLVDRVKFVTHDQMDVIAKSNPQDAGADGLIQYEVSESEVRRLPIVLHSSSRVETLHTLVHEGTHLMTPESVLVTNIIAEPDEETFSDYVGGFRFERNRKTKQIDLMSIHKDTPARFLFWESVTDWIAELGLESEMSDQEKEELAMSGYFERHWIDYLMRKSPDAPGLMQAIKESYAAGSEDSLRWCLQKQLDVQDDHFYDALIKIIGRDRTDEKRVDDWMQVVDDAFKSS